LNLCSVWIFEFKQTKALPGHQVLKAEQFTRLELQSLLSHQTALEHLLRKALLDNLALSILLPWRNYKVANAVGLVLASGDVNHKLLELLVGHHLVVFFVAILFEHHNGVGQCLQDILKETAFGFVFGNPVQV
jgi:hypothetical protein